MKRLLLLTLWWLSLVPGGSVFAADVVTLRDGRTISGLVESATAGEIRIKVGDNSQALPKDLIQSIRFDHSLTLPVGTDIAVRTIDPIDSDTANTSREYAASLDDPFCSAVLRPCRWAQSGFEGDGCDQAFGSQEDYRPRHHEYGPGGGLHERAES